MLVAQKDVRKKPFNFQLINCIKVWIPGIIITIIVSIIVDPLMPEIL